VQEGKQSREGEAEKAEAILRHEIDKFLQARAVRSAVPVLATLRARAEEIARAETEKTLSQFGEAITPKQKQSIEAMGRAIVNKLLHPPTQKLKEAGKAGQEDAAALALVVAELFNLHPDDVVHPDGETSSKTAEGTSASAGGARGPEAS
jgi:glutamyl-tRNA reductase